MKEIIGAIMVASPFVAIFIMVVRCEGLKCALMLYASIIALVVFLGVGVSLMGFE